MRGVPITCRAGSDENYSFARYLQARRIGSEESIQRLSGEMRETIAGLRQQGWITMDAFDGAVKASKRRPFEASVPAVRRVLTEFLALEKVVDEKFGHAAPTLTLAKEAFRGDARRVQPGPETQTRRGAGRASHCRRRPKNLRLPQPRLEPGDSRLVGQSDGSSGAWQQAEALVRGGSVDLGLHQMAALAAQETSGRARFLRKLMLVDVCQNAGRERLARTILEELSKQITDFKLDQWESTALVGAVWSRLYRLYKNSEMSAEQEQAAGLYNRLCQLDPWQAYQDCED